MKYTKKGYIDWLLTGRRKIDQIDEAVTPTILGDVFLLADVSLHQSHQDKFFHNQWKKILNEINCFYLTSHRNRSNSRDTYLKMLKWRHSSTLMSVFHLPSLLVGIYFPTSADKVRHKSNDWSSNYLMQSESRAISIASHMLVDQVVFLSVRRDVWCIKGNAQI